MIIDIFRIHRVDDNQFFLFVQMEDKNDLPYSVLIIVHLY